jgi:hypothetical protein
MNRKEVLGMSAIATALLVVLSAAAIGQATLTMMFREMDPHAGQRFELRVVDEGSGREIARFTIPEILAAFDLEIGDLRLGGSYRIDFYSDMNGNGLYDPPPTDHAWRFDFPDVQGDAEFTFLHNVEFTDIAWPPRIDGQIGALEYRNERVDAATGMTVYWQNDATTLYVGLVSPGTGWLSIGFGPERQMQGANILIAAIADGELTIKDQYGNAPTSHRRDDVDHVIQAAGSEMEGRSVLEFAIPLASGDDQDKPLQPGTEVTIILSYHASNDNLTTRHTKRSTSSILLDE